MVAPIGIVLLTKGDMYNEYYGSLNISIGYFLGTYIP